MTSQEFIEKIQELEKDISNIQGPVDMEKFMELNNRCIELHMDASTRYFDDLYARLANIEEVPLGIEAPPVIDVPKATPIPTEVVGTSVGIPTLDTEVAKDILTKFGEHDALGLSKKLYTNIINSTGYSTRSLASKLGINTKYDNNRYKPELAMCKEIVAILSLLKTVFK